jgi:cystathionine beta-lyase
MHKFDTRCVHSGTIHDVQEKGINSPIYPSTSFAYIDRPDTVYPRYMNTPNEKAVADKVAALEEGEAGLIFSSGMAAISTVLFAFLRQGDHAVFQQGLYGGTSHFLDREMKKFGLDYTCLLYTSPSPRDRQKSRMPSSA